MTAPRWRAPEGNRIFVEGTELASYPPFLATMHGLELDDDQPPVEAIDVGADEEI